MKANEMMNVNMKDVRKDVMQYAWYLAQKAANKFGGKAHEYVTGCVKKAWRRVKAKYYRVCSKVQLANYLAKIAELYRANKTRVLAWSVIRNYLYIECILPEIHTMSMLEGYAVGYVMQYICKVNENADLQIREPLEIRKRVIFDSISNENRVALAGMCDNAAMCYGYEGYSWTNTFLNHCEETITEMYTTGKECGYDMTGDYIEKLYAESYANDSEMRHLLDYRTYVYRCYAEVMQKYYESSRV